MPNPNNPLSSPSHTNLVFSLFSLFIFFLVLFLKTPSHTSFRFHSSPMAAIDPYKFLNITLNPDGSITRHSHFPTTPANADDPSAAVWSKDIPLNPDKNTSIRLYLPRIHAAAGKKKLPIVLYLHGGGFVFLSADHSGFHSFCEYMAAQIGVLVASVNYRLAPEHRLPAAYDDAVESLHLIGDSSDPWISGHGDLSRCVLMGESAGGNIAYHSGLRAAAAYDDLKHRLQIRGLVLIQPYFGGSKRTESETRLAEDRILPMSVSDLMWELSLPVGSGLVHEYCDPSAGGGSSEIERIRDLGWRVVVTAVDGDPLFDREVEMAKLLEKKGVNVTGMYRVGYHHGVFLNDRVLDKEMFDVVTRDILPTSP